MLDGGSSAYPYNTRDICGSAMQATCGEGRAIYKASATNEGTKASARGLVQVNCVGGELVEVFRDGELLVEHSLGEIRARLASGLRAERPQPTTAATSTAPMS